MKRITPEIRRARSARATGSPATVLRSLIAAALCATAIHAAPEQPVASADQTGSASSGNATLPRETDESATIQSTAERLLQRHLQQRYCGAGERLIVSMKLAAPEQVSGWPGRWRVPGTAYLQHYRDSALDDHLRRRELEIRETPGLSGQEKNELVERAAFLRSEKIQFEACVTVGDAEPALEFTLR